MVTLEKSTLDYQSDEFTPSVLDNEEEYEEYDLRPKLFARRRQCRIIAILLGIAVLAGIGVATYVGLSRNDGTVLVKTQEQEASNNSNSTDLVEISLEECAMHKTADDCWHAIQGIVYDLTSYAPGKQDSFGYWFVPVFVFSLQYYFSTLPGFDYFH